MLPHRPLLAIAFLLLAGCTTIGEGAGTTGGEGGSDGDGNDDDGNDDDDGDDDDGPSGGGEGGAGLGPASSNSGTGPGVTTGVSGSGVTTGSSTTTGGGGSGGTLCNPCSDDGPCGAGNYCLQNGDTGETFCGQDCSATACPGGFTCYDIQLQNGQVIAQCAPDSGTCEGSGVGGGGQGGGGVGGGGSGGGSEGGPLQGITAAHNEARANVNPAAPSPLPDLVWDAAVVATAQAYAEECVFQHSNSPYGENLYATSGSANAQGVVDAWVSEVADYNYANNSCSGVCGHYTQVVWADSLRLGCGVANCNVNSPFGGGSWQNWVCNYDPPGNWVGEKPY
jgi:pathogenesis-related protein 1